MLIAFTALPSVFGPSLHGSDMTVAKVAERGMVLQLPRFDNSKARRELGLDFIDIRQSAQDMAASLLELKVVKALPGAPVSKYYSKL